MTIREIKAMRLANQFLATPGKKLEAVRALNGVQAQFFANAMHALRIRSCDWDEATAGDGLVKNWTVRGTVHVFAEDDLPLFMHCGNGRDYRRNEWSGYSFWNRRDAWALTPERQKTLADTILDALSAGPRTREKLKEICRLRAGMTSAEEDSMFNQWGGGIREMCERGFLHYTAQQEKTFALSPSFTPIPEEEAMLEIARRYFTYYGPATVHDAMYWFHATASQVTKWLGALPVTAAACGGKTYYSIPREIPDRDAPRCLFLAGFDPLMLGYEKKESLFLAPEHLRRIFSLAGIVMPALLLDGTVAGKWKIKGRRVTVELFGDRPACDLAEIRGAAERLWPDHAVSLSDPRETP